MLKNKKIFLISFSLSVGIHFITLFGMNYPPLWQKRCPVKDLLASFGPEEKNLILEQAFASFPMIKRKVEKKEPSLQEKPPLIPQKDVPLEFQCTLPCIVEEPLSLLVPECQQASFSLSSASLSPPPQMPRSLPSVCSETQKKCAFLPIKLQTHLKIMGRNMAMAPLDIIFSKKNELAKDPSSVSFEHLDVPLPTRKFVSLAELSTTSFADAFDTEVLFAPLEKEGFFFAITLIPRPNVPLPKLPQHYDFLIDRSHSITWERLNITKHAVLKAIEGLSVEDSFNIIAFDGKIEKLSSTPLSGIPSSIRKAKEFLEGLQLGSFFSNANLAKPLVLTVPPNPEKLHSAILLTDGEALRKKGAQKEFGLGFTHYNQGKVSLFSVGLEGDMQSSLLEVTSSLNRGKILQAPSERGIKRKLLKLMKMVSHPIAKDLSLHAISPFPDAEIVLLPTKKQQIPHLYLHQPYVIFGTIKELEPFTLFIQGKIKNRSLNIKKKIAFESGKEALSLKTEWALHSSYELYHQYLLDSDPTHLAELHNLLDPFHLPVVLE